MAIVHGLRYMLVLVHASERSLAHSWLILPDASREQITPKPITLRFDGTTKGGAGMAATHAKAASERQPLDFRWFVGRRVGVATDDGAWCPIACARPVALKQCLGLPKPLWHEVLELCGGECLRLRCVTMPVRKKNRGPPRCSSARPRSHTSLHLPRHQNDETQRRS